ncbi:Activator of Hsp90 ATPase family protein [Penicillium ucsense]|uniref:Activator of Hsp90 ATPase family protein n=1 Tax=Penicillium ucsense TaxID=2839758 RepID=A0A8J8WFX5_9EURO|nr:Activator of Hsp90 ATPase family protein [Penicillium ucsense]KAF7738356.1 Activator of Hsp90 ATPase family protein [Penicillium ucsense]
MVLHNPNNWHWVNKDASGWAKEYLQEQVSTISAEQDGVSAKVDKVTSMNGDVDVSQRKGKVITLYDVKLSLEYSGKTKDGEDVSGTITVPEVAHDTEEDEYVFEIDIHSDASSKQPVKDVVRSKILPQLRKKLATLTGALITEHAKDLQHAPGVNPSAGFTPAPVHPQTNKKESAPSTTTTTSTTGKVAVNTATVNASDEFRTTAEELYATFTDPQRIAAFTRGAPRQFEGAQPGGKFAIFDGNVTGEYVKLDAPKQIVQKWRLAQWPEGHHSTLQINLDQNDVDGVTQMRVEWSGVPVGQEDVTKQNWELYYVRSIKQTFGFGTIL